ncbi:hypothetical protein V2J09_024214 [Rumex salicifolius]
MGGGGAMRAAAKAAGLGLHNVGIRSGLPENIAAAQKAIRHSTSALSSTASLDDTSRIEFTSASQTAPALAWEFDDWEFDGEQPRLVFGPAPTLEETKQATSELKDALDKMYSSPSNSLGSCGSVYAVDDHNVVSKSETSLADTKMCAADQTSVVPLVPNQALQAFKLLKENPIAQTVVASIAADPNVWNAVLQNEALKEYLQTEKNCMESEEEKPLETPEETVVIQDAGNSENVLVNAYGKAKHTVAGWLNNMSGYFQDLFGSQDVKATSESGTSSLVAGSFIGLAMIVILVVILKRN